MEEAYNLDQAYPTESGARLVISGTVLALQEAPNRRKKAQCAGQLYMRFGEVPGVWDAIEKHVN